MFKLTNQEKMLVIFVLGAFLLGVVVKHFRSAPEKPVPPAAVQPASVNGPD
jgi:hypothetical protein